VAPGVVAPAKGVSPSASRPWCFNDRPAVPATAVTTVHQTPWCFNDRPGVPAIAATTVHRILGNAEHPVGMRARRETGRIAYASGISAEEVACAVLTADGWTIRARRLRTKAGEVDAVAEKAGILSIIEVKSRPTLAEAATALTARQQSRLIGACEIILVEHPDWGENGVRFDIVVVDPAGKVRRIIDAFRADG
jgi:putative endonuclease